MFLALVLISIALVPKSSYTYPLGTWADTAAGFDLATDYFGDGYLGPWSQDFARGSRWSAWPSTRPLWPFDRYGAIPSDPLDSVSPWAAGTDLITRTPDYLYYDTVPRTTDVSREKYIRDYNYGDTEVGVRDSVSLRPGLRARYASGYSPSYLPRSPRAVERMYVNDYFAAPYRRVFPGGLGTPRPSSLRTGGDLIYMRR